MQRLMHVAHKVDKELERFLRRTIACLLIDPAFQHVGHVFYRIEDIGMTGTRPSARAGEEAVLWWVIIDGVDKVQSARPSHTTSDFIRPRGYGGEMALWLAENITNNGKDIWLKVHLRYSCNGSMAYQELMFEKLVMRREEEANLLHPMRERMEGIVLLE